MKVLLLVLITTVVSARSPPEHRIIGGQNAGEHEFPWMVSLQRPHDVSRDRHMCGGAVLNERHILTAAHCFLSNIDLEVVVGIYNLTRTEVTEQRRNILHKEIHPGYNGGVGPHDLAVVKLETALEFNEAVQPISLPLDGLVHAGLLCVSGWGPNMPLAIILPDVLQKSVVPIIPYEECYAAIGSWAPIHPNNICTGPLDHSATVCRTDSGSPLVTIGPHPELVGIVSWSIIPCGMRNMPSVYVRIPYYLDWINEMTLL